MAQTYKIIFERFVSNPSTGGAQEERVNAQNEGFLILSTGGCRRRKRRQSDEGGPDFCIISPHRLQQDTDASFQVHFRGCWLHFRKQERVFSRKKVYKKIDRGRSVKFRCMLSVKFRGTFGRSIVEGRTLELEIAKKGCVAEASAAFCQ